LERFLDATKANLFFARGVIIVEGDAENILIPTIAEIIEKPLHEYGVSIVNVGTTAYKRYAKIFLRKNKDDNNDWLDIPVSVVTDKDNKEEQDIAKLKQKLNQQNNRVFIPLHKTLEYDILKSILKNELSV
jgi:putative ATP-dependent endonuclease of OLD family